MLTVIGNKLFGMRYLVIVFLLVVSLKTKAQQLTGHIVDKNGVGIENVHVFYPETLKGTITDSLGYFILKQIPQFKNILVSCIGFCDTIIPIENILDTNIQLRKREYIIEEISVVADKKEELLIGCQKRNPNGVNFNTKGSKKKIKGWSGWFFYFSRNSNAKVKSIGLHIRKFDNPNIKLHLRILAPDTTYKTLGTDLLLKDISVPIKKGWNFIDFTNEKIRFTENGLILVFSITGLEENNEIDISGIANEPGYSWMSSLDYEKDFSLKLGNKKHKPAVRMLILE